MDSTLRLAALKDRLLRSLWFWPAVTVLVAIVAADLLSRVEPGSGADGLARFGGTPEGARAILSTVAGSLITTTGVIFSLTVVALQVASSQFTPRLLQTFLSDRGNQAVLSVFLGTFAYTVVVQRSVRSADADGRGAFVPDVAVGVGLLLTLASVGMLVYFLHHLTQLLRLETVLAELRRETLAAVRRNARRADAETDTAGDGEGDEGGGTQHAPSDTTPPLELPEVPDAHLVLRARRSGSLQVTRPDVLRRLAERHGVAVRLLPDVGEHVTVGTTIGWAWVVDDGGELDQVDQEALERGVHEAIHLGRERSLHEDVAFGIRQLVDIAARALSPGVNDPTTAVSAVDAMAEVLVEVARTPAASPVRRDAQGRVRAVVAPTTFAELLALACDQPRRYGRDEPALLVAVLRMCTDVGEASLDDARRAAVKTQIDATVERARDAELSTTERARVERAARQAEAACALGRRVSRFEDEDEDDEEPAT